MFARGAFVLALFPAIVLAACGEEPDAAQFQGPSVPAETEATRPAGEPIRLRGKGPRTEQLVFETGGHLVMDVESKGRGRFVATASASWGEALLFDTDEPVSGEVTVPGESAEPLVLRIRTKRSWAIDVTQPVPSEDDALLVSEFSGHGSRVIPVQVGPNPPGSVHVSYQGKGRLDAWLHPYDEYAMGILLVDAAGPVARRFPITQPLSGPFLLWVRGEGDWRLRFEE